MCGDQYDFNPKMIWSKLLFWLLSNFFQHLKANFITLLHHLRLSNVASQQFSNCWSNKQPGINHKIRILENSKMNKRTEQEENDVIFRLFFPQCLQIKQTRYIPLGSGVCTHTCPLPQRVDQLALVKTPSLHNITTKLF